MVYNNNILYIFSDPRHSGGIGRWIELFIEKLTIEYELIENFDIDEMKFENNSKIILNNYYTKTMYNNIFFDNLKSKQITIFCVIHCGISPQNKYFCDWEQYFEIIATSEDAYLKLKRMYTKKIYYMPNYVDIDILKTSTSCITNKIITTALTNVCNKISVPQKAVEKKPIKRSVSQNITNDILQHHQIKRNKSHNCINTKLTPVYSKMRKKFNYIGRLSPEKNIPMLIYAFIKLKYCATLHIYGSALTEQYEKYLKALVKYLELDKTIYFYGHCDNKNEMYMCDYIVLPSVYEGVSYVILEALSYNIPIIAHDIGGSSEHIEHEKNGYLFKFETISKLQLYDRLWIQSYNDLLLNIGYGEYIHAIMKKTSYKIKNIVDPLIEIYPYKLVIPGIFLECYTKYSKSSKIFEKNANIISEVCLEAIKKNINFCHNNTKYKKIYETTLNELICK